MEDFNQLQLGHSYSNDNLQKIGQKKDNRIYIYGERFAVGEQAIHIMFIGNIIYNAWFVFDSYSLDAGSFYKCFYKNKQMGFTITRNTLTGKQEVLTKKGFRTREVISRDNIDIIWFDKIEGSKKVKELRDDCRIKSIRKSIILNYS